MIHIDFIKGDAERLSALVQKESIDYAIDIESSFYYPDKEAFLREMHSVLKENGIFFYVVPILRTNLDELHHHMKRYFSILREDEITDNVLKAKSLDSSRLSHFIDQHFPLGFRTLVK